MEIDAYVILVPLLLSVSSPCTHYRYIARNIPFNMSTVSNVVDTWGDETVSNSAVTQGFIDEQSYRKDSRPIAVCASGSAGGSKPKVSAPAVVRDDWEMDDEAEEEDSRPTDERNKQIWENA